jgi:hypothetical protein
MKLQLRPRSLAAVSAVAVAASLTTGYAAQATPSPKASTVLGSTGPTTGFLPTSKTLLKSAEQVNLHNDTVRLPLHRGTFKGKTYWFVLTEASDFGIAHDLNVNYASKLANAAIGCAKCVQTVHLSSSATNKFAEATVRFAGVPDFSPTRVLVPGTAVFPPAKAAPGAVGGPGYSPLIRIAGSSVVYNAPIVAEGDGPFDVTTHTNTSDRVLAVHRAAHVRAGQFSQPSADILFARGFDSGQPIAYLSTDSSDPVAATLERATYVPALAHISFLGGDDFLGSARERIFPFVNGQTGANNLQKQGIRHLILDGHNTEEATLANTSLLSALSHGGDLLNTLGDFPSLADPRHANAYSPIWDAQFGQWTAKAIAEGRDRRQYDENQILNLAATRPDLVTGPGGSAYGATGFIINCPIIGFLNSEPRHDLTGLVPNAQG